MLKVYYTNVSNLPVSGEGLPLSDYRIEKLSSCRNMQLRKQYIGAELLLHAALRETAPEIPWPPVITVGPYGKPEWQIEDLYFSLSHSGNTAACAICDRPVGLDLQAPSPYREALVRRFFAPQEQQTLLSSKDRDADFCRIWTMKESYLKARGTGLHTPLSSFSVFGDLNAAFWTDRIGTYAVALCVLGEKRIVPDAVIKKGLSQNSVSF